MNIIGIYHQGKHAVDAWDDTSYCDHWYWTPYTKTLLCNRKE